MKLSEQHEGLLAALDEESPARLLEFLKLCHSRANNHVDLAELLQSLPKRLRPRLCSGISSQVMKGLAALHENGPAEEAEQTEEEEWQLAANREAAVEALLALTSLVHQLLDDGTAAASETLQEAAMQLHDQALLAAAEAPELQEAVAKLCTAWWQAGAPGKEGMVAQTLPYLLVRALSTGKAADVKRCHAIRTALPLLDFDDPSIADLKRLLLRATFSPAFLRPSEGRRFLSFLFTLQPQLVRELTAIVRNQIPSGRKSVLDAYREIVYRAWRDATGACAYEMEHNLIQGLMQAAIVASTPAMNSALRRVLDGLHSQKQHGPVDAMLLRLYEPIIFRAMAAANPAVRRNALLLLIDAFPLQDPDAANEETDELLSRQFSILGSSLGDEAPAVRVAAVLGLCQLLNVYWELVPAATIASFLQRLAGELAFDTAFAGVRAAVAEGLTLLVENPLAQPVLKKLLPHLGPLLQDPALKVRVAFADLLLAIMSVRALHFVDIVALDTLLDVMATDAPPVSERIQRLLLPSYFPDVEEGPARVAALLRTCPEAGKAFCQFLVGRYQPQEGDVRALAKGSGVPMENIVELAVALRDHLLASIPTAHAAPVHAKRGKPTKRTKRKKGKAAAAAEQHEETTEEQEQAEETPKSWAAMLAGWAELCAGLGAAVAEGRLEPSVVAELIQPEELLQLHDAAVLPAARKASLRIAAALPFLPAASELRARCLIQLLASPDPSTAAASQQIAHDADAMLGMLRCVCGGPLRQRLIPALMASLRPEHESRHGDDAATSNQPAEDVSGRSCEVCQEGAEAAQMLPCSTCSSSFHLSCLVPSLKRMPAALHEWQCQECTTYEAQAAAVAEPDGCGDSMDASSAVVCLGLMLEDDSLRSLLLGRQGAESLDGLAAEGRHSPLSQLLPWLRQAAHERVQALVDAVVILEDDTSVGTGSQEAASMLLLYCKAALHQQLNTPTAPSLPATSAMHQSSLATLPYGHTAQHSTADTALSTADTGEDRQAHADDEDTRQASTAVAPADYSITPLMRDSLALALRLQQALCEVDAAALPAAAEPAEPAAPPSKRGKKQKQDQPSSPAVPHQLVTIRSALTAVTGLLAMAADVARLVQWEASSPAAADACRLAAALLPWMSTLTESYTGDISLGCTREDVVGHANRLASVLRLSDRSERSTHGDAGPYAELVAALLAADDAGEAVQPIAALKPCLPALLSNLCDAKQTACGTRWLDPVAEVLGQALSEEFTAFQHTRTAGAGLEVAHPGTTAEGVDADGGAAQQENVPSNVQQPTSDAAVAELSARKEKTGRGSEQQAGFAWVGVAMASTFAKALVAAAVNAKVQERFAEVAAEVAADALAKGRPALSLGAVHLAGMAGFKGTTNRGRSRTAKGAFTNASRRLQSLHAGLSTHPPAADEPSLALQHRLLDLFPPAPRFTFGGL